MLFSLLLAHYNNSRYLDTCIQSVLEQTYTNWEIILVDDCSTDGVREVIRSYEKVQGLRVYFNNKNEGVSYTKHRLLELAKGEICAFLDPDDSLAPDALETMAKAYQNFPDASIINSTHYVCDQFLRIMKVSEKPRPLPENTPYLLLSDGSIHHFAAFRLDAYRKSRGLLPERKYDRAGDQDLYYLLEEHGPVYFVDKPLYHYRIHKGSVSNMGAEFMAMIQHYDIIENSCKRRIEMWKRSTDGKRSEWIKKYRARMYKARIMRGFRMKKWSLFLSSLLVYPFAGGLDNILNYLKKLPHEGTGLLRRSFVETYKH